MATIELVAQQLLKEFDDFPRRRPPGVQIDLILSGQLAAGDVAKGLTDDDLWRSQLYAGLAVLARDMLQYLSEHPGHGNDLFISAAALVQAEDAARYGRQSAFPYYEGMTAGFPTGLAEAAAEGRPTVTALNNEAIVHEWTTIPGFRLFTHLAEKLRPVVDRSVCGEGGLLQHYREQKLTAVELQEKLVGAILVVAFAGTGLFWVPLACCISVLIVKRGLTWYCGLPLVTADIAASPTASRG